MQCSHFILLQTMPFQPRPCLQSAKSSMTEIELQMQWNFRNQTNFNAFCDLVRSRSECFLQTKRMQNRHIEEERIRNSNVWDVKPPDFRLQLYQPITLKRNARESIIPNYNEDEWKKRVAEEKRERIRFERVPLPKILQPEKTNLKPDFVTSLKGFDCYRAKLEFVRDGKFPDGPYQTPGPHVFRGDDFRPLEKPKLYGKPEFTTNYSQDPGNIKLKSNSVDVLKESYKDDHGIITDGYRKQMITYRPPDTNWDVNLLLSKERYKKGRSAHSALMHRIEKKLPWCPHKEKIEPIHRPDNFDHKTVDWLSVTSHGKNEAMKLS